MQRVALIPLKKYMYNIFHAVIYNLQLNYSIRSLFITTWDLYHHTVSECKIKRIKAKRRSCNLKSCSSVYHTVPCHCLWKLCGSSLDVCAVMSCDTMACTATKKKIHMKKKKIWKWRPLDCEPWSHALNFLASCF